MGPGGGAIADAVSKSTSIQMLDISFNSICGNGKIELPKDEEEEKEKDKPKNKKRGWPKNNKRHSRTPCDCETRAQDDKNKI